MDKVWIFLLLRKFSRFRDVGLSLFVLGFRTDSGVQTKQRYQPWVCPGELLSLEPEMVLSLCLGQTWGFVCNEISQKWKKAGVTRGFSEKWFKSSMEHESDHITAGIWLTRVLHYQTFDKFQVCNSLSKICGKTNATTTSVRWENTPDAWSEVLAMQSMYFLRNWFFVQIWKKNHWKDNPVIFFYLRKNR